MDVLAATSPERPNVAKLEGGAPKRWDRDVFPVQLRLVGAVPTVGFTSERKPGFGRPT